MRHLASCAVLAAGCNQVYGLEETRHRFDALVVGCPPIGQMPRYSLVAFQAVAQECSDYHFNTDATLATARCGSTTDIFAGRRDEPLSLAVPAPGGNTIYLEPRPAPDSRRIYARQVVTGAPQTQAIVTFEETSGTWTQGETVPITITNAQRTSTVFRGPTGDRLIIMDAFMNDMIEYERDGATWVQRGPNRMRPQAFFGFRPFSLTTDGLRAVYLNDDATTLMYVDRPDLESWFGEARTLEGAPTVADAQLTDDCSRLYYDGLDSIFYSQQE